MSGIQIQKATDALRLPEGKLVISAFQASFSAENVIAAATLIIEHGVTETFKTQAAVVAYAGNELGWGQGEGYSTFGEPEGDVELAPVPQTSFSTVEEALALPKGRLAVNVGFSIEASFTSDEVKEAAEVLIAKNDTEEIYSQAEILARAGNLHGWGAGGGYEAI